MMSHRQRGSGGRRHRGERAWEVGPGLASLRASLLGPATEHATDPDAQRALPSPTLLPAAAAGIREEMNSEEREKRDEGREDPSPSRTQEPAEGSDVLLGVATAGEEPAGALGASAAAATAATTTGDVPAATETVRVVTTGPSAPPSGVAAADAAEAPGMACSVASARVPQPSPQPVVQPDATTLMPHCQLDGLRGGASNNGCVAPATVTAQTPTSTAPSQQLQQQLPQQKSGAPTPSPANPLNPSDPWLNLCSPSPMPPPQTKPTSYFAAKETPDGGHSALLTPASLPSLHGSAATSSLPSCTPKGFATPALPPTWSPFSSGLLMRDTSEKFLECDEMLDGSLLNEAGEGCAGDRVGEERVREEMENERELRRLLSLQSTPRSSRKSEGEGQGVDGIKPLHLWPAVATPAAIESGTAPVAAAAPVMAAPAQPVAVALGNKENISPAALIKGAPSQKASATPLSPGLNFCQMTPCQPGNGSRRVVGGEDLLLCTPLPIQLEREWGGGGEGLSAADGGLFLQPPPPAAVAAAAAASGKEEEGVASIGAATVTACMPISLSVPSPLAAVKGVLVREGSGEGKKRSCEVDCGEEGEGWLKRCKLDGC